jgi:hypothetical protein
VRHEHDRELLRGRNECRHDRRKRLLGVHIRRPVERYERVGAVLEALRFAGPCRLDPVPEHLEGVDHDIADHVDLVGADALVQEVLVGVGRWCPEHIDDRVRHHTVDLLGHPSVTAPEPGLQMHHRNPELRPHHRAGGRRVDVAHDDNPVWTVLHAHLLVGDHDAAGLLCVRAAAHTQVEVRLRDAQVFEDRVRHVAVVMLSRMHQNRVGPVGGLEGMIQRRHLHEVRAGGSD